MASLLNVKSKFILNRIIRFLSTKNFLNIIKINKNCQKMFNKNINDYKFFSEIEIEVIPLENKYVYFINKLGD